MCLKKPYLGIKCRGIKRRIILTGGLASCPPPPHLLTNLTFMRSGKQVSERNGRNEEEEEGRRIKECEHFRERRRNIQQFYSFLMLSGSNKYPECRSFPNEGPTTTGRPGKKEYSYSGHGWVSRKSLGTDGQGGGSVESCVYAVLPG